MKVAVVGGSGNVGLGVVEALAGHGHEVVVVSRGERPVPDGAAVSHLRVDRHDRPRYEAALRSARVGAIVDLVAFNADDAASTVRAARDVPHAVLCSSVSVYGRHAAGEPLDEAAALAPTSGYGRGKVAAERAFRDGRAAHQQSAVVLRPGLVYGRNLLRRQLGADPTFVDRLRRHLPVCVAEGAATAGFQPVWSGDVGQVVAAALAAPASGTYNVVGPQTLTWAEHHRGLADALGFRPARLVELPPAVILAGAPQWVAGLTSRLRTRRYDGARVAADLGYSPDTTWPEGAAAAVAWMRDQGVLRDWTPHCWEDLLVARAGQPPAAGYTAAG